VNIFLQRRSDRDLNAPMTPRPYEGDDTMHMVRHDRECIEPNSWKPIPQAFPFLPDDHPECRHGYLILTDFTQQWLPTACAQGHEIIAVGRIVVRCLPNGSSAVHFNPNDQALAAAG
jgi:hypothetical protein